MSPVEGGPPVEVIVGKGKEAPVWREVPSVPDWEDERKEAIKWEGLPPLEGRDDPGRIVFQNVKELWTRADDGSIIETVSAGSEEAPMTTVVVERGKILCAGPGTECSLMIAAKRHETFDLHGGSIVPGFMTFGSPLGVEEIAEEPSTGDGGAYDAFSADIPLVLGDVGGVVRAADALQFGTRNSLCVSPRCPMTSTYCDFQ